MRRSSRVGALVATSALTLAGLTVVSAPAAQAVTFNSANARSAGDWLVSELTNGLFGGECSFDCGNDVDVATSLMAIDPSVQSDYSGTVDDIADALQDDATEYIADTYSFDDDNNGTPSTFSQQYANSTAKLMAFFQELPTPRETIGSGGGTVNLQDRLEDLTTTSGRIQDVSTKDGVPDGQNYANTFGQAFAARALMAAGSGKAGQALEFLLDQQCAGGYFRESFTAGDPTCGAGDPAQLDATATAISQLVAIDAADPGDAAVSNAIAKGRAWLRSVQNCDGSFGYGAVGRNANSTGLTVAALGTSGLDGVAARQAAIWLSNHQAKQTDTALSGDVGAIALNDAALAAGKANGIPASGDVRDNKWRRATAQAAPGLLAFSADATPQLTVGTLSGYRQAQTSQTFQVTGAEAGTVICLGSSRAIATSSGASLIGLLPNITGKATVTATDGFGNTASVLVNTLGPKTLNITKAKSKVKRKKKVVVTIYGLQPAEQAKVLFRGVLKASGNADSAGRFRTTIAVGKKLGKGTIAGYGQFGSIRRGYTQIKVVK